MYFRMDNASFPIPIRDVGLISGQFHRNFNLGGRGDAILYFDLKSFTFALSVIDINCIDIVFRCVQKVLYVSSYYDSGIPPNILWL